MTSWRVISQSLKIFSLSADADESCAISNAFAISTVQLFDSPPVPTRRHDSCPASRNVCESLRFCKSVSIRGSPFIFANAPLPCRLGSLRVPKIIRPCHLHLQFASRRLFEPHRQVNYYMRIIRSTRRKAARRQVHRPISVFNFLKVPDIAAVYHRPLVVQQTDRAGWQPLRKAQPQPRSSFRCL